MRFLWVILLLIPILVASGGLVIAIILLIDGPDRSSGAIKAIIVLILLCSAIDVYLIRLLYRAFKPGGQFFFYDAEVSDSTKLQLSLDQRRKLTTSHLLSAFLVVTVGIYLAVEYKVGAEEMLIFGKSIRLAEMVLPALITGIVVLLGLVLKKSWSKGGHKTQ